MAAGERLPDYLALLKSAALAQRELSSALDPDVIRLLEGTAYLTSETDALLDSRLDVLCELLLDVFYPEVLLPRPAFTILEMRSERWEHLPRGARALSIPVGGTRCEFQTIYDAYPSPLLIESAQLSGRALTLGFSGLSLEHLSDRPVRIYLHGDPAVSTTLYRWLSSRVSAMELKTAEGHPLGEARELSIQPLGFAPSESAFLDTRSSARLALLREYFAFREKFLFLDITGVGAALGRLRHRNARFKLTFHLDLTQSAAPPSVSAANFRLGATPAVNIFRHWAEPYLRPSSQAAVPIRPFGPAGVTEIYRIERIERRGSTDVEYSTPSSIIGAGHTRMAQRFRQDGAWMALLIDPPGEDAGGLVSMELSCTNGRLPSRLRVGDVAEILVGGVLGRNIQPVAPPAQTPSGHALLQQLLCCLALRQFEVGSIEYFRELAGAAGGPVNTVDLFSRTLLAVQRRPVISTLEGAPVRGFETQIDVDESVLPGDGELFLLGCVLDHILSAQSELNSFSELILQGARNRRILRWPRRYGSRDL